jgi:hypothetical protein
MHMTTPNEQVIMALIEGLNRRDISVMGTLFTTMR